MPKLFPATTRGLFVVRPPPAAAGVSFAVRADFGAEKLTWGATEPVSRQRERIEHTEYIHRTPVGRARVDQSGILQRPNGRPRIGCASTLVGDQVRYQQIGHGCPEAGHEVIASARTITVVTAGDHVKIALGQA